MKLISLNIIDKTDLYTFYTIEVEVKPFLRPKIIKKYNCIQDREYKFNRNYFVDNGERIGLKFSGNLEEIINAILDLDKNYKLN